MTSERLGFFGGSFNPVHLGHLNAAEEARIALALDRVWLAPAGAPPHKPLGDLAPGEHRLRMVELAVEDHSALLASGIELENDDVSYSIDTLERLRREWPEAAITFLIGFDAFREIATWRDAEQLFELADFAVFPRPPDPWRPSIEHLPVAARDAFCYDSRELSYRHRSGSILRFLTIPVLDVSASAIRDRAASGRSLKGLVPPSVERYIVETGLYRASET